MQKTLVDVNGDGNCFYRALYGYILFNGTEYSSGITSINEILNNFSKTIPECKNGINKNISTIINHPVITNGLRKRLDEQEQENEWIKCLRYYIANYIDRNKNILEDNFNYLIGLSDTNYKAVIDSYPGWFKDIFKNDKPDSLETFAIVIANYIRTDKKYASYLDIGIIKNIFYNMGYNIIIRSIPYQEITNIDTVENVNRLKALYPDNPDKNTFYLININEAHYNFIWYDTSSQISGGNKANKKPKTKYLHNNKLYTKYKDKSNKKEYIKMKGKNIYV
jgi:hypothetical protein